ncbi:brca-like bacitracin transport atp-binding protein [Amylolactobacillus amylotrophicus DSM 20534]|uniref:Multidrug ABC transporter ATP-binding protein n=3 Tax=Amylolactobacillus TaxID=2767876 RepID=A0A1L6XC61_9LACO|nr:MULTISPECIES: ABC transporter ATP-binding protein [Amylolactobacillus]APT18564.1 multidrug ABC transporter ATP-binding protein [Amylolactobacillus amylophilus DSM 20533 = JCM 1125]KRK37631.1 brca-like bacitracin transport atp-binding protein [Amylolactobacillus amylotrophicus DSM 20534]KRM43605.1 brca-like bacitracin transport atp-binding protein [Amylolactobacillus amylophilus DSM 20533 = JCM 1125]GED80301.1 putative ABC transporter ATP-binding protein YybJ [Amylolactobacillus amylophilus]
MPQINFTNYTKVIKKKTILDDITFQFDSGKIYGLHGRNGSGKTMILRAISGLIFPTSGSVQVGDQVIHKDVDFPAETGVIIEHTDLLPQYTAFDNLKMLSRINNVASDDDINSALLAVGLEGHEKEKVKSFSLGMRQKLSIAQAIFEHPKLLLLDEPTNALDQETIRDVRQILLGLKQDGATIIIASHNKEDLDVLADEILLIHDERINIA